MTGFDIGYHENGCECCAEPIELGIKPWLNIRAHIPHDDEALLVFLYHNWSLPDTVYVVFDQTHRILGLYPPNPLLVLLGFINEDDESQA
jgi:hypothetical protein